MKSFTAPHQEPSAAWLFPSANNPRRGLAPSLALPLMSPLLRWLLCMQEQRLSVEHLSSWLRFHPELHRGLYHVYLAATHESASTPLKHHVSTDELISTLGEDAVWSSLVSGSLRQLLDTGHPAEQRMWSHAAETACVAQLLARTFSPDLSRAAHLAGVLHDVGQHLILRSEPGVYRGFWWRRNSAALAELEQANVGISHNDAGGLLLSEWNVDERVLAAVLLHDDLESAEAQAPSAAALTALVWLADNFRRQRVSLPSSPLRNEVDHAARLLSAPAGEVRRMLRLVRQQLDASRSPT